MKSYIINLTDNERDELHRLATTGRHSALKRRHAQILLKADDGLIDEKIAEHLDVSVRTIERVRKRCTGRNHCGVTSAETPTRRTET